MKRYRYHQVSRGWVAMLLTMVATLLMGTLFEWVAFGAKGGGLKVGDRTITLDPTETMYAQKPDVAIVFALGGGVFILCPLIGLLTSGRDYRISLNNTEIVAQSFSPLWFSCVTLRIPILSIADAAIQSFEPVLDELKRNGILKQGKVKGNNLLGLEIVSVSGEHIPWRVCRLNYDNRGVTLWLNDGTQAFVGAKNPWKLHEALQKALVANGRTVPLTGSPNPLPASILNPDSPSALQEDKHGVVFSDFTGTPRGYIWLAVAALGLIFALSVSMFFLTVDDGTFNGKPMGSLTFPERCLAFAMVLFIPPLVFSPFIVLMPLGVGFRNFMLTQVTRDEVMVANGWTRRLRLSYDFRFPIRSIVGVQVQTFEEVNWALNSKELTDSQRVSEVAYRFPDNWALNSKDLTDNQNVVRSKDMSIIKVLGSTTPFNAFRLRTHERGVTLLFEDSRKAFLGSMVPEELAAAIRTVLAEKGFPVA